MSTTLPLLEDNYYHIYNRGIHSCNLFEDENNYEYFLSLYGKYISPIAKIYAYVLVPNHFLLLIVLKDLTGLCSSRPSNLSGLKKEPTHHAKPSRLKSEEGIEWFGDQKNYEYFHNNFNRDKEIEDYLNL